MESAIPALIILTLLILLSMTLAEQILLSHQVAGESWLSMEERQMDRSRTRVSIADAWAPLSTQVHVLVYNEGQTKLADFDEWDVILRADNAADWLDYSSGEWSVEIDEGIELGILNPGETMTVTLYPDGGVGSDNLVVFTTPNGVSASQVFTN